MFAIQARRLLGRLPRLVRLGATLMIVGAVLALAQALGTPPHDAHVGHQPDAHAGHLMALAGMVVTLVGVVMDGAGRHVDADHAPRDNEGDSTHAPR